MMMGYLYLAGQCPWGRWVLHGHGKRHHRETERLCHGPETARTAQWERSENVRKTFSLILFLLRVYFPLWTSPTSFLLSLIGRMEMCKDQLRGVHKAIKGTLRRRSTRGSSGAWEESSRSFQDAIAWITQQKVDTQHTHTHTLFFNCPTSYVTLTWGSFDSILLVQGQSSRSGWPIKQCESQVMSTRCCWLFFLLLVHSKIHAITFHGLSMVMFISKILCSLHKYLHKWSKALI